MRIYSINYIDKKIEMNIELVIINDFIELIKIIWNFLKYLLINLAEYHSYVCSEDPLMINYNKNLDIQNLYKTVKEKFNVDLYIILDYDYNNNFKYKRTFKLFLNNNNICDGWERNPSYYFKKGSYRQGGVTFDLHNLTKVILNIDDIKKCILFS
jgi:hypothetical protein